MKCAYTKGKSNEKKAGVYLACGLLLATGAAQAVTVNVNGYDFDLDQFAGAVVTSNTTFTSSNQTDQHMGVDPYAVGDMISITSGDVVSLGNNTTQEWLKLNYATGFYVGTGMSRLFVVYEGTSATALSGPDAEGTAFEISFNGGTFIDASNYFSLSVYETGLPSGTHPNQNQIVFDLTNPLFGFNTGDLINMVEIRNVTGRGSSSDPDFTFIGHAGTSMAPIPEPATMTLMGLGFLGMAIRRRMGRSV